MGTRVGKLRALPLFTAIVAALALSAPVAQADDCASIAQRGQAAHAAGDLAAMEALIAEAAGCPEVRFNLQLRAAAALWNRAVALNRAGAPVAEQKAALEAVLGQAPLWQAHAALGDMASDRGDHAAATGHYQEALNSIAAPSITPNEPPEAVIASLFRKAQVARMLSPVYVATTRSRSGAPTGLAATSVRSFGVQRVAVPVQFVFGSAEFTDMGAAAAADMLDYLALQEVSRIRLIGHTDPVGSREFNLRLSAARAEAVREYLLSNGFAGEIAVEGRGPDEPLEVDNPGLYSTEQLHQIYRRVELVRD